jgi:hypothetical protein
LKSVSGGRVREEKEAYVLDKGVVGTFSLGVPSTEIWGMDCESTEGMTGLKGVGMGVGLVSGGGATTALAAERVSESVARLSAVVDVRE